MNFFRNSLILGFTLVPTYYAVYQVTDKESGRILFIKEFKTKGAAVEWIDKFGESGVNYRIDAVLRKEGRH